MFLRNSKITYLFNKLRIMEDKKPQSFARRDRLVEIEKQAQDYWKN